ncbi:Kinase/ NEK / Serine/threonine protein kinase [Giardia duodenalis assemblage B]|uniref:Kinase/ NEK / Serine/threonine protein kinase n=1 Tax=Giardia duodenalis assemblage B TaxID=1394984 RepID=A0A132NUH6_GIAIN|nr:Kinase/ NEK / Serine/threonine protein kinase [Giardia intestinalis assemblage B]
MRNFNHFGSPFVLAADKMSADEFSRDFEIVEDIINRPSERLLKVRSRTSGICYACRRIDTSRLTTEQLQMLEAEIHLFQQLDGKVATRYLRVLRNDEPGIIHLIMEYCDDGTLEDLFIRMKEKRTPCTEERARAISSQIAHALSIVRSAAWGLDGATIMGALTPKSVFLLSTGKIRFKGLCSWHTAGQISISSRADYMVSYTAPEVFTSNIYNEQSEVWTLGCILYEALTAKRCFSAETETILRHNIVNCKYDPLPNSISEGMRVLVSAMLTPDYRLRPTLLDVRLSLKILSDAEKMHHWDTDIIVEVNGHPTPVANSIQKLIEAHDTDIISSLQATRSPVISSYIYTDLKTSKDSGNVYLAGRVVLTEPVTKTSTSNCTDVGSGLSTGVDAYARSNISKTPTSYRLTQRISIRSTAKDKTGSAVHTPSMSIANSSMRQRPKLRSVSSSFASQLGDPGHQQTVEDIRNSCNPNNILNKSCTPVGNADIDSSNLTISNLNVERDCLRQKAEFLEHKTMMRSTRSASVRLPSMSLTTKPANLQLLALRNATGGLPSTAKAEPASSITSKPSADAHGTTDLMIAAMQGSIPLIERYIGTQSGMRNHSGMTALMLAAERGQEGAILPLLATEGCMHASLSDGHKGKTALMFAATNNHLGTVCRLLEAEAGQQDEDGNTALMLAAKHQFTDVVEKLVHYEGRQVNARGETALMMAAAAGDTTSIGLLINIEAGMVTTYGWTALCFAAMNNHLLAVEALIQQEAGLQCFQNGCNGITALMIAAEAGYLDTAAMLVEREILLRNSNGEKAIDLAIKAGQTEMVTFLEKAERLLETGS